MKIVETLLVRDEEDVVGSHLAFHLNAGVDFVVAIDHESTDGTTEVLEAFARDGHVRRIEKRGAMREEEWRTELARVAAAEHGADWVINADADQFWWPRRGDLHATLGAVPARFKALRAFDRVFVPRPDDGAHFAERMTYRVTSSAPINAPASTYRPLSRVVHRGHVRVAVTRGSHSVSGDNFPVVPNWYPVEVLHFPWRSPAQMARKAGHLVRAFEGSSRRPTAYHAEAFRAVRDERALEHFEALAVGEEELERGLRKGFIAIDTRLRDALRALGPQAGAEPGFAPAGTEDAGYAAESAALRAADTLRAQRLLDSLERRVETLERRIVEPHRSRTQPRQS